MKKLETRRLILREWRETDADDLYAYAKSDKVGPMCGWKPHKDILETKEILKQFSEQDETWALELKETGRVIGSLGLHKTKKKNFLYTMISNSDMLYPKNIGAEGLYPKRRPAP